MNTHVIFRAALIIALSLSSLSPTPARAEPVERVVAQVDGQPIFLTELRDYIQFHQVFRPDTSSPRQMLDALIDDHLLVYHSQGVIDDAQLEGVLSNVIQSNGLSDEAQLRSLIEDQGVSWALYLTSLRAEMGKAYLIQRHARDAIDEAEVDRLLEERLAQQDPEWRYDISMLTVPFGGDDPSSEEQAKARVERLAEQIRADELSFEQAREGAEGFDFPGLKTDELNPDIAPVISTLDPGEISAPVRLDDAYILLLLRAREPLEPDLEALRASIRQELQEQALEAIEAELMSEIRSQHFIINHIEP